GQDHVSRGGDAGEVVHGGVMHCHGTVVPAVGVGGGGRGGAHCGLLQVHVDAAVAGGGGGDGAGNVGDGGPGHALVGALAEGCRGRDAYDSREFIAGRVGDDGRAGAEVIPAGGGRGVDALTHRRRCQIDLEAADAGHGGVAGQVINGVHPTN